MIETAILSMTTLQCKVALGSNYVGRDGRLASSSCGEPTIRGSIFWTRCLWPARTYVAPLATRTSRARARSKGSSLPAPFPECRSV